MEHRDANVAPRDGERAPSRYPADFVSTDSTAYFRATVSYLLRDLPRSHIPALLGHRAHRGSIHHWLTGRYEPPQWALDMLRTRVEEIALQGMELAANHVQRRGPTRAEHARRLASINRTKEKARKAARALGQTENESGGN